jgi:hypothetical protein
MSVKIKVKRGQLSQVLSSATEEGELLLSLDTNQLFATNSAGDKVLVGRCGLGSILPTTNVEGSLFYNLNDNTLYVNNGGRWLPLNTSSGSGDGSIITGTSVENINCLISGEVDNEGYSNCLIADSNNIVLKSGTVFNINGAEYKLTGDLSVTKPTNNSGGSVILRKDANGLHLEVLDYKIEYVKNESQLTSANSYYYNLAKRTMMTNLLSQVYEPINVIEVGHFDGDNQVYSYSYRNKSEIIIYVTTRTIYNINPRLPKIPDFIQMFQTDDLNNPWATVDGDYNRYSNLIQEIYWDNLRLASSRYYVFHTYTGASGERNPYRSTEGYLKIIVKCEL